VKLEETVKESRRGEAEGVADQGTSSDTTAQAVTADSKCDYIVYTMRDHVNEVVAVLIEMKTTRHSKFKHAIAQVTSLKCS